MACFTLNRGADNVPAMSKENMIWHPGKLLPRDLLVLRGVFPNLGFFWVLGHRLFMTFQTILKARLPCEALRLEKAVTVNTFSACLLV